MAYQDYLGVNKGKIKLKLDTSELYDYKLSNNYDDLYLNVVDFTQPLQNDYLKINEDLIGHQSFLFSIALSEIDYRTQDENYIYSGLTLTLNFNKLKTRLNTSTTFYEDVFLTSNIYVYTGLTNEVHYFQISDFNQPEYIDPLINGDMDTVINNFDKNYFECINSIKNESCDDALPMFFIKPMIYKIESPANNLRRRTEKGWTLEFIFNRNYLTWDLGGVFYYLGVRGENNIMNLADNNLTFGFTPQGEIAWYALRFSGVTNEINGYTGSTYISSGKTQPLCLTGNSEDFKVNIVFERYREYVGNEIDYNGGKWDLVTGCTIENDISSVVSGETAIYNYTEELNKKWSDNLPKRLGRLKIYLNGNPIYILENWEEVIPSNRGVQPLIQSWGGGPYIFSQINFKLCYFIVKSFRYYETPLLATEIKKDFNYDKTFFNFEICGNKCY